MGRKHTSKAEVYSLRLNPIHEADALIIAMMNERVGKLDRQTGRTITKSDVIMTALLRYGGHDPVAIAKEGPSADRLAEIVHEAVADALRGKIAGVMPVSKRVLSDDDDESDEPLGAAERRWAAQIRNRMGRR
jgi:hypothetical protein